MEPEYVGSSRQTVLVGQGHWTRRGTGDSKRRREAHRLAQKGQEGDIISSIGEENSRTARRVP